MDARPKRTTFGFKWLLIYVFLTVLTAIAIVGNTTTGPQALEVGGYPTITYHKFDTLLHSSQLARMVMLWVSPFILLIYLILLAVKRGQGYGRGTIWTFVMIAFAVVCQIALAFLIKAHPALAVAGTSASAVDQSNYNSYLESHGVPT